MPRGVPAALLEPVLPKSFTAFALPFRFDGSPLRVASRARDEGGAVQPSLAEFRSANGSDVSYHVNAIATWLVGADGTVSSGDAA